MKDSVGYILLIQFVLIFLNGIFACAEIAVLSVSSIKLEQLAQSGNRSAVRLQKLTAEPARFLSVIQIAITLSGFLGSAFAAEGFSDRLVNLILQTGINADSDLLNTLAVILITVVLAFFSLVFGELVPKRIAMQYSEQAALLVSGPVLLVSRLFRPLVWVLSVSTNALLSLLGIDPSQEKEDVSEEEIRMLVDAGGEKGAIDKEEQEFIQNVFEFDDITAGEIATHRTDVVVLWLQESDEEWSVTLHNSRHTMFPVCDDSPDKVVGILNAKEYFRLDDKSRNNVLQHAVQVPYFVPETLKLDVLFRSMKKRKNYLAVVLDEYGGMEGIVTLNDLLEELVGNLDDYRDGLSSDETAIEMVENGIWRIKGNVELAEIEQVTGISLVADEYDTFTGLVFDKLGMVPPDGSHQLTVDLQGCRVMIKQIKDHQVAEAVLQKDGQEL